MPIKRKFYYPKDIDSDYSEKNQISDIDISKKKRVKKTYST